MSLSSFLKRRVEAFADNLIFWAVVSGSIGGAVIAGIAARSAYLTGSFPLYKAIGLGLLFLLIVGLFLFLVALAFNLTASGTAKRRQALMSKVGSSPEHQETRLELVAASDRRDIDLMVFVYGVKFENLIPGSHSPSIRFHFDIFNGSVYPISIDPSVLGFISYGDRRLKGEMTLSDDWTPHNLQRGWTSTIRLDLWLEKKDAEFVFFDLERAQTPAPLFFNFDHLIITIHGGEEYSELVASKRLKFRGFKAIDKNNVLR